MRILLRRSRLRSRNLKGIAPSHSDCSDSFSKSMIMMSVLGAVEPLGVSGEGTDSGDDGVIVDDLQLL